MKRALAVLGALAFGAVLFAGCGPATPPPRLRYAEPFTCEASLNDLPCIQCLKEKCCAEARTCDGTKQKCPCATKCLATPTKACADACSAPEDKAMATCAATACALICPGTGFTI